MISFNPKKVLDFFFVVTSSFFVAMAGNYFFDWDFQFGLTVGLILGSWVTLYDIGVHILVAIEGEDDEEDEIPPTRRIDQKKINKIQQEEAPRE